MEAPQKLKDYLYHELFKDERIEDALTCIIEHKEWLEQDLVTRASVFKLQYNSITNARHLGELTRQEALNNESRIYKGLSRLIEEIEGEVLLDESKKALDKKSIYNITIDELKLKLNNYLLSYDINATLSLLRKLVSSSEGILQLENKYQSAQWEFNYQEPKSQSPGDQRLEHWLTTKSEYFEQVRDIIESLSKDDLKDGWKTIIHEQTISPETIFVEDSYLLFPSAEDIEPLIKPNTSEVDKGKYRRLLHLAQDAYKLNDYEKAYTYCREVLEFVEPESVQLYEYLLLSFFKKEDSKEIIENAIAGENSLLQHIFVYSNRIKSLQSKSGKFPPPKSKIWKSRIEEVVDNLAITLQNWNYEIQYDYILKNKSATDALSAKEKVQRYIRTGVDITKYVTPKPTLIEVLINELAGGGKFAWIGSEKEHQLINNYQFKALSNFRLLLNLDLENADQSSSINLYVTNLENSLKEKYEKIVNEMASGRQIEEIYSMISRWISACKTAHLLFSDRCETEFLKLAYDKGLGSTGSLDWFILDEEGRLTDIDIDIEYGALNVRDEFSFIVKNLFGPEGWKKKESELIDIAYNKLRNETERLYQNIRLHRVNEQGIERKVEVIRCIKNWMICYRVYRESVFIDKCIRELIGEGIFLWFDIGPDGDKLTLVDLSSPNFDVSKELENLLSLTETFDYDLAVKKITENLFFKQIEQQYLEIEPLAFDEERQRNIVLELIDATFFCYRTNKNSAFLDLIFRELLEEKKFRWFDISDEGIEEVELEYEPSNSALDLLETLYLAGRTVDMKYDWGTFKLIIAKNRYRDLTHRYRKEFNILRRKNWRLASRIPMVEVLKNCRKIFHATKNIKHLELPDIEWVQNRGKIRWRFDFFGLSIQHWQNSEIGGFNYRKERREVKELLKQYSKYPMTTDNS